MVASPQPYAGHAGIGMTSMRTRKRLLERLREQGIRSEPVLKVIAETPRHLFLDKALSHKAYENTALPIGQNQTISQPFMVALMTEFLLEASIPMRKILEVGTGCGYQTAVLSPFAKWIFTIERIESLQQGARTLLPQIGCRNVSYLNGDGFAGWPSNQPFDGILVAAAPPAVPPALLAQLQIGGRLVIPVGDDTEQNLRIITRTDSGFDEQQQIRVRFVPMVSDA